jgi:hypothetical protein
MNSALALEVTVNAATMKSTHSTPSTKDIDPMFQSLLVRTIWGQLKTCVMALLEMTNVRMVPFSETMTPKDVSATG